MAKFTPGGFHLMCEQPKMKVGGKVAVSLSLSDGSAINVSFDVKDAKGKETTASKVEPRAANRFWPSRDGSDQINRANLPRQLGKADVAIARFATLGVAHMARTAMLLEITLVIILGLPEGGGGFDLGHHRLLPAA